MFETSKDVLFIVLATCAGLITVFTCMGIYYCAMILKNANKMVSSVREKMELVDKILNLIKDKLEKTSSHFGMAADSVIKLVGFVMDKQKESKERAQRKAKKASKK